MTMLCCMLFLIHYIILSKKFKQGIDIQLFKTSSDTSCLAPASSLLYLNYTNDRKCIDSYYNVTHQRAHPLLTQFHTYNIFKIIPMGYISFTV